jgi:hypothetical protein
LRNEMEPTVARPLSGKLETSGKKIPKTFFKQIYFAANAI